MTFSDLYARTVIRRDWFVCGERMLPLTIGHARILESLDLWRPTTWLELMTCAWVCARPSTRFRMPRGFLERIRWRVRLWRLGGQWFPRHAADWIRYVDHHLAVPVISWKGKGGKPGTPSVVSLRAGLIGIGYRPETLDQVPIDVGLMDFYAVQERDGLISVTGRSMEDLDEQIQNARRHVQSLGKN